MLFLTDSSIGVAAGGGEGGSGSADSSNSFSEWELEEGAGEVASDKSCF